MRHLRTYRLFENQEKLFSDKEMEEAKISLYDRIKGIIEGKIKPSKIRDVFGLEYADSIENVDDDDFDDDKLEFCANLKDVEDDMGIENGSIEWVESTSASYSNYEYYIDDEEYNYIHSNIEKDNLDKFRNLCRWLGYGELLDKDKTKDDWERNEGLVYEPCEKYGLVVELLEEMKWELSHIKERSVKELLEKELNDVTPLYRDHVYHDYKSKKDSEFEIDYEKTLKFLETEKIKDDVFTIEELLENIGDKLPYTWEIENDAYDYEKGYDELNKVFGNDLDALWDDKYKLPEQKLIYLLIVNDNVDVIKEKHDDIIWDDKYDHYREVKYLPEYANKKSKVYEWFVSDEFNKKIQNESEEFIEVIDMMILKEDSESLGLL